MRSKRKVVVTGRGVVSPLGIGLSAHGDGLLKGRSAIARNAKLASMGLALASVAEVPEEELLKHVDAIPRRQRKLMNRAGVLAGIASTMAMKEAALSVESLDPVRSGVVLATWHTAYELTSFIRYLAQSASDEDPRRLDSCKANVNWTKGMNPVDYSLKVLPNLSAGHLAILHRAQGYSRLIADGWRGGLLAVAQAADAIRHGELDVALAGGTESTLEEGILCDLSTMDVMAPVSDVPDRMCRPFDIARAGSVVGEGAAIVLLESEEHAATRGAAHFGEIAASASSAALEEGDAEQALVRSMRWALAEAGLRPHEVDLIHANGDSTPGNDRAEFMAIGNVFGARARSLPVAATKSQHGHLLSAAGAMELVNSLIMMERGIVPPILNCDTPDPECRLDLVREVPRHLSGISSVLLNAVGLFGESASLIVRR